MIDADIRESMNLVRESAGAIVRPGDLSRIRELRHREPGFSRETWREMCAMGWPSLRLADAEDGSVQSILLYCALMEELGAGLVPEPLVPATLAATFLPQDLLDRHLSGDMLVIPAWQDRREALRPDLPLSIENGRLDAVKLYVPAAAAADAFLVLGNGGAALVEANRSGVTITSAQTQDGGSFAKVVFEGAPATFIPADPPPAFAEAALATSAYLLGIIDAALAMTIDYLKTRVQFGKAIGSFQALQHIAVDLKLEATLTRASLEAAALTWDREPASERAYCAVSRARVRASRTSLAITRACIQLHGGIGFTDEHDISLYLRKAMVVASQFGSAAEHAALYTSLRPIYREG